MRDQFGPVPVPRPRDTLRTWKTKDGRELRFAEMEQKHLENLVVWADKRIAAMEAEKLHTFMKYVEILGDIHGDIDEEEDFVVQEYEQGYMTILKNICRAQKCATIELDLRRSWS